MFWLQLKLFLQTLNCREQTIKEKHEDIQDIPAMNKKETNSGQERARPKRKASLLLIKNFKY